MSSQQPTLQIPSLTRLERIELEKYLSPDEIKFEERPDADDRHGDLGATAAIVIVSVVALKALTTWILLKHRQRSFRMKVLITHVDGRVEDQTISYRDGSSEAPDAAVLKQLNSIFKTDIKLPASDEKN
jgi:hypothetical protein